MFLQRQSDVVIIHSYISTFYRRYQDLINLCESDVVDQLESQRQPYVYQTLSMNVHKFEFSKKVVTNKLFQIKSINDIHFVV